MEIYSNKRSPSLQDTRIEILKLLTGINDIEEAFYEEHLGLTEIEIIYLFLKRKTIPMNDIDPIDFLITYIGFSFKSLQKYNLIDEMIYCNCSYYEIIYIAINKILTYPGNSNISYDCDNFGFPKSNNFIEGSENTVIDGKFKWIPLTSSFSINSLENYLKSISESDTILLYRGHLQDQLERRFHQLQENLVVILV